MKLIGIAGKKRSGKDTAANILVSQAGYTRYAFANLLKSMVHVMLCRLGIDPTTAMAMTDGDMKEMPVPQLCGKTARHAMQTLGTEWGRDCIDKDFWVQACLRAAVTSDKAVISDVRFANEAQGIRDRGGKIILIERENGLTDDHPSEVIDFEADYVITNEGTIEDLADHLLLIHRGLI